MYAPSLSFAHSFSPSLPRLPELFHDILYAVLGLLLFLIFIRDISKALLILLFAKSFLSLNPQNSLLSRILIPALSVIFAVVIKHLTNFEHEEGYHAWDNLLWWILQFKEYRVLYHLVKEGSGLRSQVPHIVIIAFLIALLLLKIGPLYFTKSLKLHRKSWKAFLALRILTIFWW